MSKGAVLAVTLLASLLIASTPVQAQTATIQETLLGCKLVLNLGVQEIVKLDQAIGTTSCVAVVDSVTTMLAYGCHSSSMGYFPLYAAKAPHSTGAAIQTFVNWAEANPELWGENAVDGVIASIMESFPCEEGN